GPTATATISTSCPASRSRIASSTPYSSIPSMTNVTPDRSTRPPSARTRASASGTCLTTVSTFMLSSARSRRSLQHAAGDDEPLYLVRALVDLVELHVAHQLLHRVLVHVAVAAEDVDRLLGGLEGHVRGVGLRDRRRLAVGPALVDEPGGVVGLPPRGLDADLHVGELEL